MKQVRSEADDRIEPVQVPHDVPADDLLGTATKQSGFACVVSTVSGETDCGFDAAEEGGTYTLGAGEAALRISTTSGNVELAPLA